MTVGANIVTRVLTDFDECGGSELQLTIEREPCCEHLAQRRLSDDQSGGLNPSSTTALEMNSTPLGVARQDGLGFVGDARRRAMAATVCSHVAGNHRTHRPPSERGRIAVVGAS